MVASLLILLGVLGKSAQFPLHAWLPDAMAGPSPVSALIHAATMVAAGIYVVARLYPMFLAAPGVLTLMAVIACLTMLGAAVIALGQSDLKRVLAWSTVSQLAYMMAALAVGSRDAAIFHLLVSCILQSTALSGGGCCHLRAGNQHSAESARWSPTGHALDIRHHDRWASWPWSECSRWQASSARNRSSLPQSTRQKAMHRCHRWVGWLVLVISIATIAVTAAYATRLWRADVAR